MTRRSWTPILALAALVAVAAATQAKQRVAVPLSEPGAPAKVRVELMSGSVAVVAHDGREVIVEALPDEEEEPSAEAPAGMRRIPNTSWGLSVVEKDNVVEVEAEVSRTVRLQLSVPVETSVELATVNDGDLEVRGVRGEHELSNVNGDITAREVSGSVVAETVNGDVEVVFDSVTGGRPMAFSTLNGDIEVTLPGGVAADLVMTSDQGEIYTDFDLEMVETPVEVEQGRRGDRFVARIKREVRGRVNGGGPEIRFHTYNGDVYIKKRGGT